MSLRVARLYRYPVKGLSPETLDVVELLAGGGVPGDRRLALAHGETAIDPDRPTWQPKRAFVALDTCPELAALECRWNGQEGALRISLSGKQVACGNLDVAADRAALEAFFSDYVGRAARGRLQLVEADGFAFADAHEPLLSVAGLASLGDVERRVGQRVDVRRFRVNLVIEGGLPWQENDWVGKEIRVGGVRLEVVEPILRCAAIEADPVTGERELDLLRTLVRAHGEAVFGVYARVVGGGRVSRGDVVDAPPGGRFPDRPDLEL